SIWGFVRAVFDPLHRGHDAVGIAERLGFAWSGIAYLSIVVFALHIIAGSAASGAHDGTQEAIARILTFPGGASSPSASAWSPSGSSPWACTRSRPPDGSASSEAGGEHESPSGHQPRRRQHER